MKILRRTLLTREAQTTSRGHRLWIEILIFILIFFIINIAQVIIVLPVQLYYLFNSKEFKGLSITGNMANYEENIESIINTLPDGFTIYMLFSTVVVIVAAFIYCRFIEKRSIRSMGFVKHEIFREYILGILVGAILFGVAVLLCVITGSLQITGISPNFTFGIIFLFFIGFMIQGMSEEVLLRGYFMISIARKYSLITAVLVNSILFSMLHLLNNGITILAVINLLLFGIFASVYMIKRGSIWGIAALHTTWNFVQGNIFGIKVSGTNINSSVFSTTVSDTSTLFNGGSFGLEGGLIVTIVLIVGIAVLMLIKGKIEEGVIYSGKGETILTSPEYYGNVTGYKV